MKKKSYPLSEVYRLIEPGPVVMLTAPGRNRPDIMTLSWHTMMEFEPPLVGCVVSNRNYSFDLLRKAGECVINIPDINLAKKTVLCGNITGRRTDKFKTLGLTPLAAKRVKAPLIKECFANLECRIFDRSLVRKYNFFILEVLQAWVDPSKKNARTIHHRGRGLFGVTAKTIKLPSRKK
ncbi:flavin reductase family protein [Omnitrophica bacterium]|nr:flavin reductase family protein [Candidatus Omnitrophota bacterium]